MPPSQGGDASSNLVGAATQIGDLTPPEQVGPVPSENLPCIFHLVGGPLPFGLHHRPELEILDSIVGPDTIAMMDDLVRCEWPSKKDSHGQAVFSC